MKDDHKIHKHRHRHEEHIHKKCRRKRDKYRSKSRSRSQDRSSSRSRGRSRSNSYERSKSKSPVHSKSKHRRRSKSRSQERTRTFSSPDSRRDREAKVKSEEYRTNERSREAHTKSEENKSHHRNRNMNIRSEDTRSNGRNERVDVKPEPYSDVEGRSSGRRTDEKPRWGKSGDKGQQVVPENKAKPDFGLSGKLAEEVNTYKGVVIKYSEPPEARMPKRRWRLYPFKGDQPLPTLYVHRQSAYLIGRDRIVADLPIDHPSCSKQHAVLQYRVVPYTRENGMKGNRIRPYIIDLESANGTFVNNKKIEPRKYVELLEKDVIKFAFSSREYVVLHEHSRDDDEDDNVLMVNE